MKTPSRHRARGLYAPELLESRIAPATFIVNSLLDNGDTADKTTLREAIDAANAKPDKDTIIFDRALVGEIVLNGTDLDITAPLTIKGPGADLISVSGNDASRIFNITDGNKAVDSPVSISGLTLRKGTPTGVRDEIGGAIFSSESLSLKQAIITGNWGKWAAGYISTR